MEITRHKTRTIAAFRVWWARPEEGWWQSGPTRTRENDRVCLQQVIQEHQAHELEQLRVSRKNNSLCEFMLN
jgi:hypothetical protein